MLIPSRVALALQADGWLLRNDVIWHKPNPMPASVRDRLTVSHEHIFLLAKRQRYYYDAQAIEEPGIEGATRNARDVWRIPTRPYSGAHFAVFPEELPRRCILAGSSPQACEQCGAPWQRTIVRSRATHTQQPDPTRETGRQGFNRHRPGPSDHYVLGIPQPELAQRLQHAAQGREAEMEERFGSKWAHWLRTDASGARIPTAADADELETLLGISIPFDGKAGEWQSTCRCENEGTGRSVVLDPFVGSGTTLRVAERLGRDSIGIELGDYEHLQQERTAVIQREMEIA
jgi:hypothetical protein